MPISVMVLGNFLNGSLSKLHDPTKHTIHNNNLLINTLEMIAMKYLLGSIRFKLMFDSIKYCTAADIKSYDFW